MANFPISLASYSFHGVHGKGCFDVYSYLEAIKFHYNVVNADIWTGLIPTLEDEFISKVKAAMDVKGIQLANLCVDGPHLWVDTAEGRKANKEHMLQYIQAASKLGAKTIRIDFGGTEGHTMSDEAFEYIVNTFREYCKICGDLGMKIGPENHWGWDRVPAYLKAVKEAVDSPYYGHLYHLFNFHDEPELGEEIAISYAMHTHIHAKSIPYAKDIIRKLAKSGYEGTFSVEHHSGEHEFARVEWQLGAVRTMIEELKAEGLDEPMKPSYFQILAVDDAKF